MKTKITFFMKEINKIRSILWKLGQNAKNFLKKYQKQAKKGIFNYSKANIVKPREGFVVCLHTVISRWSYLGCDSLWHCVV